MGVQELFTELKKIAVVPIYEPTKSWCIMRNFTKCVGNPGTIQFGGSENPLLNIRTHLHFVHIPSFFGRKPAFWNTKRTCFLDF